MAPRSGANPSFSAAVKLADLDDYLAPAQNCIVPLLEEKPQHDQAATGTVSGGNGVTGLGRTAIQSVNSVRSDRFKRGTHGNDARERGRANLIRVSTPRRETLSTAADRGMPESGNRTSGVHVEPGNRALTQSLAQGKETSAEGGMESDVVDSAAVAKVSLYDCLACSGCVTSAEAVLLDHHSVDQFMRSVRNFSAKSVTVVSISFQSVTAIAHEFSSPPGKTLRRLSTLFRLAGAQYVLHTQVSDAIAVLEAEREFIRRYRDAAGRGPKESAYCQAADHYKKEKQDNPSSPPEIGQSIDVTNLPRVPADGLLPVLTSFCPGLMCYAEKSLHPSLLPYFSRVRSSQQIQGVLVKGLLRESHNARSFFFHWRVYNPLANWFLSPTMKHTLSRYCHFTTDLDGSAYPPPAVTSPGLTADDDTRSMTHVGSIYRLERGSCAPAAKVECPTLNQELTQGDVFHVCVMPCFDKKLEAARPGFRSQMTTASDGHVSTSGDSGHLGPSGFSDHAVTWKRRSSLSDGSVPDVDLVLATNEVLTLMERLNLTFDELDESPVDHFWDDFSPRACQVSASLEPRLAEHFQVVDAACSLTPCAGVEGATTQKTRHPNDQEKSTRCSGNTDSESRQVDVDLIRPSEYLSGSGGYTDRVFRRAAWELFGVRVEGPLDFTHGRNEDFKEVSLVVDGEEKLRFAIAYGFRNIRNVVQRLKREIGEEMLGHNTRDRLRSTVCGPSNRVGSGPPHDDIQIEGTSQDLTAMSRGRSKRLQRPFPHFIELAACPGGCLNGGGQTLSQGGSQRSASNSAQYHNSRDSKTSYVTLTGKSAESEAQQAKEPGAECQSGSNAGEKDSPGKVEATSVGPDCEAESPLPRLTELLHTSFVFHDPLRWQEVEQAYRFLQGSVASPSSVTTDPGKSYKREWSQLHHARGSKEDEATYDWWKGAMNEEEEWRDLYTDFNSVSNTLASSSNATMASLKW